MHRPPRPRHRPTLAALALLAGLACGRPIPPTLAAASDYDIGGGHFFTEASTVPGAGFAITDADGAPLWDGYLAMGGPKVLVRTMGRPS